MAEVMVSVAASAQIIFTRHGVARNRPARLGLPEQSFPPWEYRPVRIRQFRLVECRVRFSV